MNNVKAVLSKEAKARGLTQEDIDRLLSFSRRVGEIESNNDPLRTQGDDPMGIGRGKYQFEGAKGSNAAKTAANRLKAWEEKNGKLALSPQERKELAKSSPDFTKLSEDAQDALFFVNLSQAPKVPLTAIAKGKVSDKDAWIKYHWAGNPEEAPVKAAMWDKRFNTPPTLQQKALQANTFPEAMR